jgi:transposase
MATIRSESGSVTEVVLYVAFELGDKTWKLGVTCGWGVAPVVRSVAAWDLRAVARVIGQARARWGLSATARVVSCYEAGRDGFSVHAALGELGLENQVVDSSSIEVSRRARRTKTDRLDATKLVLMLVRVVGGEPHVWRPVRVPSAAVTAARELSRERTALVKERTRLGHQVASLLALQGCRVAAGRRRGAWWTRVRDWRGAALPAAVQARVARATERLALVQTQIRAVTQAQAALVRAATPESPLGQLVRFKGVATTGASTLLDEGLVWRAFRNRREVGGVLGLAPAPYQSGETARDQGVSRAGNRRLQAVSIQLAWNWVRWQPASAITQWYWARFGTGRRARRVGIVAVARKLLIALWRYATTGRVPEGAILKPAIG